MFTVTSFVKIAILQTFSCFRLTAEEDLKKGLDSAGESTATPNAEPTEEPTEEQPEKIEFRVQTPEEQEKEIQELLRKQPKTDKEKYGHVKYMNILLARTLLKLYNIGFDINDPKVKRVFEPINNYIENYTFGKVKKFEDFKDLAEYIAQLIAEVIVKNFDITLDEVSLLPKAISIAIGKRKLNLNQPINPQDLKHKKIRKTRSKKVDPTEIEEIQQEIKERDEFKAQERKEKKNKQKKTTKLLILERLKKAFFIKSEENKIKIDTEELKKTKSDIESVSKSLEELNAKMEKLNALIGG